MLSPKTIRVRQHVLSLLENGALQEGDQIPPARTLAAELDISFLKVQQAIETLVQDGILESEARKGTFVQAEWYERILPENISMYASRNRYPWISGLERIFNRELPGLRLTHAFSKGMLELKTTLHVQRHHDEYMDLSELLAECVPDMSALFTSPFAPFRMQGKLVGIPILFSPRVLFYNPTLFRKAGCAPPSTGWTWNAFLECVESLKSILPRNRILNWHTQPYLWLNFVLRAGGRLTTPSKTDPVAVDSPKTRHGLKLFADLGKRLGAGKYEGKEYRQDFLAGNAAMLLSGRQLLHYIKYAGNCEWETAPLPTIPGGLNVTSQATDLICIRKGCVHPRLARQYIRLMLSDLVQDHIGNEKYGIPILKRAAFKSIDTEDPRDALFATELHNLQAETGSVSPRLMNFLLLGTERILLDNMDIDTGTVALAQAARTYQTIQNFESEHYEPGPPAPSPLPALANGD